MQAVRDEQELFWKAVGRLLRDERERQWGKSIAHFIKSVPGAPSSKTISKNEEGDIGHASSLNEHAAALGLTVMAIFKTVLVPTVPESIPGLEELIQRFVDTTHDGRDALLKIARLAPTASATSSALRR